MRTSAAHGIHCVIQKQVAMQITPYPDIDKLLSSLLSHMQRVLGPNLAGLYIYGSLVTGDFDLEISDVDLLAVTPSDIDDEEFEQLHTLVSREYKVSNIK